MYPNVCVVNQTDELIIMKAPLKAILKNFLDHVEDLETRKKLFDDQYETEFQELKNLTDKLKEDPAYSSSFGLKDVNRPKNRYKDIVPYDFSRVILPKYEGIPGSDYINASYIKGASGALAYIAAQGPLPNTVIDFWRMVWICDVQVLVMACNVREAGKFKCEAYWPGPGEIKQYGNISIELVNSDQVCPDFLVRTLLVKCGSEMRDVYQFHYTSWPDHGVPETVQPILDLVRLMRDCQASETVPIVVHCSAGCGRTGTICAVDYVWACLRHGKLNEDFSLYQIALELRRQRIAMIQTKEQYILAHKAVAAMFEQQLKVIDCHIYENLDEDGEPLIWKEVGKGKEIDVPDFMRKIDTKEKTDIINKLPIESKNSSKLLITPSKTEKIEESSIGSISYNSSVDNNLNTKVDNVNNSSKNSESSYSRNSLLSQQSTEDSIPFIDDDDVCIRPNCGRAYLEIPSCDSISKLVNCFDPFVDKVSVVSDDSSPDGDPLEMLNKIKDFQSNSTCKTLDKNSKISAFNDSKNAAANEIKHMDSKSDIIDTAKKSLLLNNRESYPPCTNSEKFQKISPDAVVGREASDNSEDVKGAKKVGKATVVRRPSISKLKALFEKSGISSQKGSNDGSKRLLFRNNSHHVSRAGSAPPSLDCMDKSSAVEKESILRLVTRKFRSSSVRTEREMQAQEQVKTLNRRSATDTVKDGFNALTRTMSFSINKTFKSYSLAKVKPESNKNTTSSTSDSIMGIYKPKSPDQPKSNSMWYDRSSLPRAVAVVKPTGKFQSETDTATSKSPTEPKSPDKNKPNETQFNYISKPAKLKDFFSSLNKKDAKDPTTLWYNESNTTPINSENNLSSSACNIDSGNSPLKSSSRVLPFLPIAPWKKVGPKSPLSSPDSPKSLNEPTTPRSSTFYTNVFAADSNAVNSSVEKNSNMNVPKCPVPEEIIPLNLDTTENKFWPSNSLTTSLQSTTSENPSNVTSDGKENIPEKSTNIEMAKSMPCAKSDVPSVSDVPVAKINDPPAKIDLPTKTDTPAKIDLPTKTDTPAKIDLPTKNDPPAKDASPLGDVPPAIPKKMIIGKNKNLQNIPLDSVESQSLPIRQKSNDDSDKSNTETKSPNEEITKPTVALEKNDLYMNVNIKAMKNIEQIENALRKNPRGAIIDLTSRESYSMEEELVNAVNQLSEPSEKNKAFENKEKSKSLGAKSNSKFPGYEVIWPEKPYIPVQKSKSSSKVPLINKTKSIDNNSESLPSNHTKTGLCYSPPLRRSVGASLELAKSQSCGNLDWLEPDDSIKEPSSTPTKRLVNEAVVELNTLLNQLTTRTLSEDADFVSKSKEKHAVSSDVTHKNVEKPTKGEITDKVEKRVVSEEPQKQVEKPVINVDTHRKVEKPIISKETLKKVENAFDKAHKKDEKPKESSIISNDTVVHSVTLVTKSYNSGSSPKEEEIVFHFPPPPKMPPPPKEDPPVESFNIVCRRGSLVVKELDDKNTSESAKTKEDSGVISLENSSNSSDSLLEDNSSQKFPQPAPRKSKQNNGIRRSASYTNIAPAQSKNKGYENVFLEKFQTLSRLEIKPEIKEPSILDKVVPLEKSPLFHQKQKNSTPSNYVNVGNMSLTSVSNSQDLKPATSAKPSEPGRNKVENLSNSFTASSNRLFHGMSMFIVDDKEDSHSVYGKIYKSSDKRNQNTENIDAKIISRVQDTDVKKKPVQSKKSERAPLPPNIKQMQSMNNDSIKTSPNNSMISKKIPSRKLEKAPLPPHLLQKSSSTMNVPQRNLLGPQPYVNFPPAHQVEEKPKLPAVRENMPNVTDNAQIPCKKISPPVSDKFVNRGLSHSQSDVSVYLALKERRMQSTNQERKLLNMKSLLMNKRTKNEPPINVSSSDSDSSYERIFLTKDEPVKTFSKGVPKEQTEQPSIKSYRKEVPVAPPRSKRRSTTEVQYTKVKAKDASHISTTSQLFGNTGFKNSKMITPVSDDDPPAIPMKTRDAFEIPEK